MRCLGDQFLDGRAISKTIRLGLMSLLDSQIGIQKPTIRNANRTLSVDEYMPLWSSRFDTLGPLYHIYRIAS